MSEETNLPQNPLDEQNQTEATEESSESTDRYPELAELQSQIDRRIRDNQKFLDHFLDEDFLDDEDEENDGDDEELQPEL